MEENFTDRTRIIFSTRQPMSADVDARKIQKGEYVYNVFHSVDHQLRSVEKEEKVPGEKKNKSLHT